MSKLAVPCTVAVAMLAAAVPAVAQAPSEPFDRGRNQSVRERPRPEIDPTGMPAGAFRLFPYLGAALESDDNVFASETAEQSDVIAVVSPGATLRSQWSRHELALGAHAQHRAYMDFDDESTTTWNVNADGRIDVRRDLRGRFSVSSAARYEPRGENDPLGLLEPIDLTEDRVFGSIEKEFNRVRVSASATRSELDFEDGRLGGGGVFDQDFRDRDLTEWDARVDFALTSSTAVFVSYADRTYDYAITTPGPGGDRDFDTTQALAGLSFDLSNLMRGELGVGQVRSEYEALTPSFEGFSQYAALEWFATRLTTVSLRGQRDIVEAGVFAAATVLREHYVLSIDHELYRNVVLGGEANWRSDEFDGIDRDDDIKVISASVDWFVNRLAVVNASIFRHDQESEGVDRTRSNDRTGVSIGVTLRR